MNPLSHSLGDIAERIPTIGDDLPKMPGKKKEKSTFDIQSEKHDVWHVDADAQKHIVH